MVCIACSMDQLPAGYKADILECDNDHTIDVDKDDMYEFLVVDVRIHANTPGEFSLMGYLCDSNNNKIIWSIDHKNLLKGDNTMQLIFGGKSIRDHLVDGPYFINDLTLMSGSSDTRLDICDYHQRTFTTSAYNYSNFET